MKTWELNTDNCYYTQKCAGALKGKYSTGCCNYYLECATFGQSRISPCQIVKGHRLACKAMLSGRCIQQTKWTESVFCRTRTPAFWTCMTRWVVSWRKQSCGKEHVRGGGISPAFIRWILSSPVRMWRKLNSVTEGHLVNMIGGFNFYFSVMEENLSNWIGWKINFSCPK